MYLTAHEVRSPSGEQGINAFLHLHREQALPLRGPDQPDIDIVPQFSGGYPVARETIVPPGGNLVLAYLDLVAPDAADEAALRSAVDMLSARIGTDHLPITVSTAGVAARLGAVLELEGDPSRLRLLLHRLASSALALLDHRHDPPGKVAGPYVIWASYGPSGVRLWLPPATLLRVPPSPARRVRVLVPHEVLHSGVALDVLRECAVGLLGVGEDQLSRENGIEIVDPRTGKNLARYDASSVS